MEVIYPVAATHYPEVVQGGMGPNFSDDCLARVTACTGKAVGTVSGTLAAHWVASELTRKEPDVLRALRKFEEWFPGPSKKYLRPYVGSNTKNGLKIPKFHPEKQQPVLAWTTIFGSFAKIWLASEEHEYPIWINVLEHLQDMHLLTLMGAVLAFSLRPHSTHCAVVAGAGLPWQFPQVLEELARFQSSSYLIDAKQQTKDERSGEIRETSCQVRDHFSLWELLAHDGFERESQNLLSGFQWRVPSVFAIVTTYTAVAQIEKKSKGQIAGYVVENWDAGGHNPLPRDRKEMKYGPKDEMDYEKLRALGKPFYCAGAYASPQTLAEARTLGAVGVQCGSIFALSRESGLVQHLKQRMLEAVGTYLEVVRSFRSSPTFYAFMVPLLKDTLGDPETAALWERNCTIGVLRTRVYMPNGSVAYRCPAEKISLYEKFGGKAEDAQGRQCLCRALSAACGMVANTKDTHEDAPILTFGIKAASQVTLFLQWRDHPTTTFSAKEVVEYLLSGSSVRAAA